MTFKINGIKWKVRVVSPEHPRLIRSNGSRTDGCCDRHAHSIYLNGYININKMQKVLYHEITHAAMFSYDIDLSLQQEELIADLLASYGKEIITTADNIFNRISKKRGTI